MSFFRNTVWLVKGLREYTSGGFTAAAKGFNKSDLDVDCKGKSYMITGYNMRFENRWNFLFCISGANSGIGKQTALEIASRGGTVHMVCRSEIYSHPILDMMYVF